MRSAPFAHGRVLRKEMFERVLKGVHEVWVFMRSVNGQPVVEVIKYDPLDHESTARAQTSK